MIRRLIEAGTVLVATVAGAVIGDRAAAATRYVRLDRNFRAEQSRLHREALGDLARRLDALANKAHDAYMTGDVDAGLYVVAELAPVVAQLADEVD